MIPDTIPTPPPAPPNSLKNARNVKLLGKILNVQSSKDDSSVVYQIKALKLLKLGRYAPIIAAGDTIRVVARGDNTNLKKGETGICTIYTRLLLAKNDDAKESKLELINWINQ